MSDESYTDGIGHPVFDSNLDGRCGAAKHALSLLAYGIRRTHVRFWKFGYCTLRVVGRSGCGKALHWTDDGYQILANTKLFQTILCPIDFSDHSRQALAYAVHLSIQQKGRLAILFVEDPMLATAAAVGYDERVLIDKGHAELRRLTDKVIARHRPALRSTTFDVAVGRPHEEIARSAERMGADFLVMGSHDRTGASKVMLGSTTHRILRKSPVPVLAIPPVQGRPKAPSRE